MLPGVIREIRLHETLADELKFFKDHRLPKNGELCLERGSKTLLDESTEVSSSTVRDACRIVAKMGETGIEIMWEIIEELWVKILIHGEPMQGWSSC